MSEEATTSQGSAGTVSRAIISSAAVLVTLGAIAWASDAFRYAGFVFYEEQFLGGMLAVAGAGYQGVFRNPLADPYLLGVAAGAGLGATLAIVSGASHGVLPVAAFVGGTAAGAATYALGRTAGGRSTHSLILAGVAVAAFLVAVQTYVQQRNADTLRIQAVAVYADLVARGEKVVGGPYKELEPAGDVVPEQRVVRVDRELAPRLPRDRLPERLVVELRHSQDHPTASSNRSGRKAALLPYTVISMSANCGADCHLHRPCRRAASGRFH